MLSVNVVDNFILITVWWSVVASSVSMEDVAKEPSEEINFCPRELTGNISLVLWPRASSNVGQSVGSFPPCLSQNNTYITRECLNSTWVPAKEDLEPCCHAGFDLEPEPIFCPDGYTLVDNGDDDSRFCFLLYQPSSWWLPCLESGLTTTLLDLDEEEIELLFARREFVNVSFIWLPAERMKSFGSVVWRLPGQLWGTNVNFDDYNFTSSLYMDRNCLLFDVSRRQLRTERCSNNYRGLCLYKEDLMLPANCPKGYMSPRFSNGSDCYGIEFNLKGEGATWQDFTKSTCKTPTNLTEETQAKYFIEIAKQYNTSVLNDWCWTGAIHFPKKQKREGESTVEFSTDNERMLVYGAINRKGHLTTFFPNKKLNCMACQQNTLPETPALDLNFNAEEDQLLLTIYSPKSMWREKYESSGLQCFSNTIGFVRVAKISDYPLSYNRFNLIEHAVDVCGASGTSCDVPDVSVDKAVFEVSLLSQRPGEYWCEGHLYNLTHITTPRLFVWPQSTHRYMFALTVKFKNFCESANCNPCFDEEEIQFQKYFKVKKVIAMDILDFQEDGSIVALFHIVIELSEEEETENIHYIIFFYDVLIEKAVALDTIDDSYYFVDLRSTTHCLPEKSKEPELHWLSTQIGQIAAPIEFCLQVNGLPVRRQCSGNFEIGGYWRDVEGKCGENYEASQTTEFLYNVSKGLVPSKEIHEFLTKTVQILLEDGSDMIPADIYYLAMSLQYMTCVVANNENEVEVGDVYNMAGVVDKLLKLDKDYLRLAQTMNSTNVLLDSFDSFFEIIANNHSIPMIDSLAVTNNFIIQISEPILKNITGLALIRPNEGVKYLSDFKTVPLYANTSVNDVLKMDGLEVAAWVSQSLLNTLRLIENKTTFNYTVRPKIMIGIFYDDAIFPDVQNTSAEVNGRIISVAIPGYHSDLEQPIYLAFGNTNGGAINNCGFWDYGQRSRGSSFGRWDRRGCYTMVTRDDVDVCGCFHLTHFAQLIVGSQPDRDVDVIVINIYHDKALNVITVIGCSLSLVGISGIAITAIVFRSWRQKPSTKVLLQLSCAIALQSILMVILNMNLGLHDKTLDGNGVADDKVVFCVILGASLHYSVLAAFTWMLITAVFQFIRYVRVIGSPRPPRFMFKSILFGWGVPFIPVCLILIINYEIYVPPRLHKANYKPICYPHGWSLLIAVFIPIVVVILTNLTIFVLVMCSVMRGPDGKFRFKDSELTMSQLRLSIILYFLLGLSWIFGLFTVIDGQLLFSYLFCLTATLQGFVFFVYFVICDPSTRLLWISLVRVPPSRNSSEREFSSSLSK